MNKINLRGRIRVKNKRMFLLNPLNLDTGETEKKEFYLKDTYVNEFLTNKYKNKVIEFRATIEGNELRNINNIKKENINYNEEERRLNLRYEKETIFIGEYEKTILVKTKKKYGRKQHLFKNIKTIDGREITDHILLEITGSVFLKKKKKYIFKTEIKKYKKEYSTDIFYGFKNIEKKDITILNKEVVDERKELTTITNITKIKVLEKNKEEIKIKTRNNRILTLKKEDYKGRLEENKEYVVTIKEGYDIREEEDKIKIGSTIEKIKRVHENNTERQIIESDYETKEVKILSDIKKALFITNVEKREKRYIINYTNKEKINYIDYLKDKEGKKRKGIAEEYFIADIIDGTIVNKKGIRKKNIDIL